MQILADIYRCQYGAVKDLADATDSSDLMERLYKLKDRWEALCPGFYKWFVQKRKPLFEDNVIESETIVFKADKHFSRLDRLKEG